MARNFFWGGRGGKLVLLSFQHLGIWVKQHIPYHHEKKGASLVCDNANHTAVEKGAQACQYTQTEWKV
jgi:hypothetical protein